MKDNNVTHPYPWKYEGLLTSGNITGGTKDDGGKPRMDLLPPELLTEVAKVLAFGANKYAPRNWEKGMDWGRVHGAALRHITSWASGENTDPETGLSHLAHAACNLAFLIAYEKRNVGVDTRFVLDK